MPELPEVETVRRGLAPHMQGKKIHGFHLSDKKLRFCNVTTKIQEQLSGSIIKELTRRGKYLCVHLDNGKSLIHHLGMSGSFRTEPEMNPLKKHDHIIYEFADGARVIYNDPRRFGMLFITDSDAIEAHPAFAQMGVEPTSAALQHDHLYHQLKNRKVPIKSALLNQHIIAGLGNIYVCEALFLARISPLRSANTLRKADCARLSDAISAVIEAAIKAGGSTLKDHKQVSGETGYFQHNFKVYGRKGLACENCSCHIEKTGGIKRVTQSGRSTFYCPHKQK
tara:strand:+ start:95136 stop:95978 length:843 start_codon:yes stop_codon:yes gene_type:complete